MQSNWEEKMNDLVKVNEQENLDKSLEIAAKEMEALASKEPKLNRAQRRAQQKAEAKRQREIKKMIDRYIAKHPEAVQVQLDEEKISDIIEKEEDKETENNV